MKLNGAAVTAFVGKNLVVTVCVAVGLVLLVVIHTRSGLITDWQAQIAQKSDEARRYRANLANAVRLPEEVQVLKDANQRALARTIHPTSLAENLQYFYRLGEATQVKYSDLRQGETGSWGPVKAVKHHPYVLVNYSINAQGDFPAIITYLRKLERGVYFYRLNSMSASGTGSQVSVHLNIDLLGQP